jgi:siroheme synthase
VSRGTLPDQRTATAPLCEIAHAARELESPALLIVGDTVALERHIAAAPLLQSTVVSGRVPLSIERG